MEKSHVQDRKGSLKKTIGVVEATLLVVGIVIGSGVFYKPTAVLAAIQAPGFALLIWVIGGALTLAGSLTLAEIGSAIPKTGGLYVYIKELFGDRMAFLFGWVQILVYYPGLSAALAVILATQTTTFIPLTSMQQKFLAAGYMILIMAINIASTKFATKFNTVFTIGKLMPIIFIAIFGMLMGDQHSFTPFMPSADVNIGTGFSAALLGVLFGYEGWIAVSNLSGELKNPKKDYPKAIFFGIMIITVAYLGVNIGVLNAMSVEEIIQSDKVVSDAAVILFGNIGSKIISVGILVSIVGSLSGFLMSSGRLPYAMAQEKMIPLPKFFGKVADKGDTPINSLIFITVLSIFYIFSGSYNTLTDLSVFVTWMFLIIGMSGIFVLRTKRKELSEQSDYKVPFYPVVPIIGIVGATYVVGSTLISGAKMAIFGVIIMFLGLPIYEYLKRKQWT
ncbi:APC family permease [Vagococcus salmoninarum]|uniref:Amino acid permease n=1 Tax=Vagococcus salmoninarum TaxID=2739 RepID=A0A429ZHU6_9ENTE|nr:amino acid permease [Vagococcus salmoninarum]RST93164.1 amino acid permease [Vagococcus salmoninarum]